MNTVTLVLALHNHQPVGNFGWVNRAAVESAYLPFLDVARDYPDIPFCLHISGSLLEWAERNMPSYVEAVRDAMAHGEVELLGGGRFEPIFPALPERDRTGQLRSYAAHLEAAFGVSPRGAWLPERVFEQSLVSSLARAGVQYTVVDDYHLKRAGERRLSRHFITEDQGRTLFLFPSSEPLRYKIPFASPEEVVAHLAEVARSHENALVVYADDGEKFGVWPGTHKHVYEDGWLVRFFDILKENASWIRLETFSSVLDRAPDPGLIFLPDSSYREMVEWSMPVQALRSYRDLESDLGAAGLLERTRPFIGGGFWRNFRIKYSEVNRLYSRMMEVSTEVHRLGDGHPDREKAVLDLYRGQVNCVYWHGVFGGIYLPHLRLAAYRHLLSAENTLRAALGLDEGVLRARVFDFDFDGHTEVAVEDGLLKAYLAPHRGGALFELDVLPKAFNLLMTMTRREEDYHRHVSDEAGGEDVASIHDLTRSKQEGMRDKIAYDRYDRASLVDHFFGPGLSVEGLLRADYVEEGDFVEKPYSLEMAGGPERAEVNLFRKGTLCTGDKTTELSLVKRVRLDAGGKALQIHYALLAAEEVTVRFGPEFNFAMLAGDTPDRYYFDEGGESLGRLGLAACREGSSFLGLRDEWMGLDVTLGLSEPAAFFLYPVETVSQSEQGFELLYQQSCVTPVWTLDLKPGERREVEIILRLDWKGGVPEG